MRIIKFKKSTVIVNLFVFIVFLQNPPWPLWDYWFPVLLFCFLISSVLLFNRIIKARIVKRNLFVFICLLVLFYILFQSLQKFRTSSFVTIIIFFQLFYLTTEEKCSILDKITTILSIIITISLPLWLINQFVFDLPFGYNMQYGDWKGKGQTLILENYYFFVQAKLELINRFYSIFDEPGTLGTLASFLLFANKYNFKDKRNVIILVGAFFTYSFAFFVLTFIGLILYNIRKPKLIIILGISITIIGVLIFKIFKGNPTFNASIIYRITNPESSLQSRTSKNVKVFFNEYVSSGESIFGKGTKFFNDTPALLSGNGFQFFLIENGFIGLFLVIGMYLFIYGKNKFLAFSYLLLFLLSFLQRPFLFTPYQLIVYYAGIASLSYMPSYNKNREELCTSTSISS